MDDLFNQIVNISKAGAYNIVSKQVQELQAENDKLKAYNDALLNVLKDNYNIGESKCEIQLTNFKNNPI